MRPLTAALLLASLAGAAAEGDDDGREKPPPLAQVMSIPDLTEVCGPCNECMGPEAAKTDPDDAAIIGIKVTSCLKKCAPCVKDFLNVYCTMSPTRVMITQPCCYDLSASVSKRLEEGTASVVKLITKRKDGGVGAARRWGDLLLAPRRPHRRRRRGGGDPPRSRRVPVHAVRLVAEGAAKEAGGVEWGSVSAEESLLPV